MMVRDFHAVIGRETREQAMEKWGGKPDILVACVGGGSNAMGLFHEFVDDEDVKLIGVEAAGEGMGPGQKHAATLTLGKPGVLHGSFSYLIQDEEGQIIEPHSISAGLDYPGIGPEHSFLKDFGRAEYHAVTDEEALDAFVRVSRMEGIIPALRLRTPSPSSRSSCPRSSRARRWCSTAPAEGTRTSTPPPARSTSRARWTSEGFRDEERDATAARDATRRMTIFFGGGG